MVSKDTTKIKEDILYFLKEKGPSLPVQISSFTRVDTLFISAFLSELLQNQQIKITTMKVGSSPVYYLSGDEAGLEKYSQYLKSKEKEAFELLKQNKFLEDNEQEPAIKVALRQIKDFAKPFENKEKIIWRYYLIPKEKYFEIQKTNEKKGEIEYNPIIEKPKEESEENISKKEDVNKIELQIIQKKEKIIEKKEEIPFKNPLAKKEESKQKSYSEFVKKTIEFINKQNWNIIQEIEIKNKEYNALIEINSDLGPIIFKTQAKDKKTITELDLTKLLSDAQSIPLPALILFPNIIQKKAINLFDKFSSILKFKKIE